MSTNAEDFKPGDGGVLPKTGAMYDALKNGRSWCGTVTHNMSAAMMTNMSSGGMSNRSTQEQMNNTSGSGNMGSGGQSQSGGGQSGGGTMGGGEMKAVPFSACFRPFLSNGAVVGASRPLPWAGVAAAGRGRGRASQGRRGPTLVTATDPRCTTNAPSGMVGLGVVSPNNTVSADTPRV